MPQRRTHQHHSQHVVTPSAATPSSIQPAVTDLSSTPMSLWRQTKTRMQTNEVSRKAFSARVDAAQSTVSADKAVIGKRLQLLAARVHITGRMFEKE